MQAAELRALAAEARVAQLEQALEASRTAAELAADAAARELEHLKMSFQRERDTLLCELGAALESLMKRDVFAPVNLPVPHHGLVTSTCTTSQTRRAARRRRLTHGPAG